MSKTINLPVKDLSIDLSNFRTVPQANENHAIEAMISISPDYFWGLMESLIDDGYLPTENIIVLESDSGVYEVREGNRRIASLKIILRLIDASQLNLPPKIIERIDALSESWKNSNSVVPCAVYQATEEDVVDRIVTRTHGKAQKAGRDSWEAIARARHNKIKNGASEPALDLLEKYLSSGTNLTIEQKIRWSGKYNLSVLDEAIKKIAPRFGVANSGELAKQYPSLNFKTVLEAILSAIGMETLTFPAIRESKDFASKFGLPPLSASISQASNADSTLATNDNSSSSQAANPNPSANTFSAANPSQAEPTSIAATTAGTVAVRPTAAATNDERSVKRQLRLLKLFGNNRSKIETLRKEILKLKLKDNPIAFCFLLRSIFEISAKAYCQDNATDASCPKTTKKDGKEKTLAELLKEIVSHLSQNGSDKQMLKLLHGSLTEIARHDGILSITSMNQLVHNPTFTISPSDIPPLFSNIFPLLEQINK